MNRPELALAGAALATSILALFVAATGRDPAPDPRVPDLVAAVAGLQARDRAGPADDPAAAFRRLEQRLVAVETSLHNAMGRAPAPAAAGAPAASTGAADAAAPGVAEPTAADADARRELDALVARLNAPSFDWQDPESLADLQALSRHRELLQERLAALEAAVAAAPGDTAARMQLADYYIARLLTANGAEQALWGSRAEQQWQAVRELDPDNWESRFRIGNNYAFYPDVMGKTGDAIALLTEALEVQRRQPVQRERARTFLSLSRMQQRQGDRAAARATLEEGLRRHPGHDALQQALAALQ